MTRRELVTPILMKVFFFFFYEVDFTSGLRFLVHPFVRELFSYLHLALAKLVPNSWRIVVFAWWYRCLPMMAMSSGGTNSSIFIV